MEPVQDGACVARGFVGGQWGVSISQRVNPFRLVQLRDAHRDARLRACPDGTYLPSGGAAQRLQLLTQLAAKATQLGQGQVLRRVERPGRQGGGLQRNAPDGSSDWSLRVWSCKEHSAAQAGVEQAMHSTAQHSIKCC